MQNSWKIDMGHHQLFFLDNEKPWMLFDNIRMARRSGINRNILPDWMLLYEIHNDAGFFLDNMIIENIDVLIIYLVLFCHFDQEIFVLGRYSFQIKL